MKATISNLRRNPCRVALIAGMLTAGLAGTVHAQPRPRYDATIVRTTYGIPHITARDHGGIGYGVGFTAAQDNVCVLADQLVTVRGERARFHGGDAKAVEGGAASNIESDIYYRVTGEPDALRRSTAALSADARALIGGFAAGYNRYLQEQGARLPAPCGGQPWVQPMTSEDAMLLMQGSLLSSMFLRAVAAAAPPGAAGLTAARDVQLPVFDPATALGSNGWAFGSEATANGRGLVVGNPHYPWDGANRFRQMHLTISGHMDVMGAGLIVTPLVGIGFNKDVAWTHTVTTARHATLFELQLDPADPTAYLVDGRSEKMTRRDIRIEVKDGQPVTRTVYGTRYGPVVGLQAPGLGWSTARAYAWRDANFGNYRGVDAWLAMGRAKDVREIRQIIGRTLGIGFTNTIAADRAGEALYADVTAVPYVTAEKLASCGTETGKAPPLAAQRIFILDGARSACNWDVDPATPQPGLMPDRLQPTLFRRDFVQNSNDSYWLSNPAAPLPAASPLIGPVGTRQSFRTQSGITEIQRQLAAGRMTPQIARELILANKSMAAERILDDLIAVCADDAALAAACTALRGWDREAELDSRGALLFFGFLRHSAQVQNLHRVPFDAADPVNTPRGIAPEAAAAARQALKTAADELTAFNIPLDAPLGSVQAQMRGPDRVPIHGGPHIAGILNMMQSRPTPTGLLPVHGSSYIQVVTFDETGPVADALLTYSQSTDPASPHFYDQTRAFSEKKWHRLPFAPAEIRRAAIGPALRLRE